MIKTAEFLEKESGGRRGESPSEGFLGERTRKKRKGESVSNANPWGDVSAT